MSQTLPKWLTVAALEAMGGEYVGEIASVRMMPVRNPYTRRTGDEPVITFDDAYKVVPNVGMRRGLIAAFGKETNVWLGRRITVRLQHFTTKNTGELRSVKVVDVEAAAEDDTGIDDESDARLDEQWGDLAEREAVAWKMKRGEDA